MPLVGELTEFCPLYWNQLKFCFLFCRVENRTEMDENIVSACLAEIKNKIWKHIQKWKSKKTNMIVEITGNEYGADTT
jgi:hypothetical protein